MKKPQIIHFPKINDPRGNLTFFQNWDQIPFEIKRTFWTYDVPAGEIRGGHAYKLQNEIIIALSGSFDVVITSIDNSKQVFSLNRSNFGLYIPSNNWRHIENFSTNAVVLHISDQFFEEDDYIRNFEDYIKYS
jgi:dTDP-4-dehydrorhamnose 3,5-epimerase-like enzyme